MDEFEQATQSGETEKAKKGKKQKRRRSRLEQRVRRILAFIITAALILGAVYVVANWDNFNADSLRRLIAYRSFSSDSSGQIGNYSFHGDASSSIAMLDGNLLVCSTGELQIYQRNGDTAVSQSVSMKKPVIDTAGDYAVAYDAGGTELYLIYRNEVRQSFTAKEGQEILSARVSSGGYVTLVQQATGYKASTTVYDGSFKALVTENISSSFTMDATLSPDGKTLALVSVGEDSSGFDSVIIFYNVSDGQEKGRCALGSDVVLDLNWSTDGLWCIGGYGVYLIQNCALTASYVDSTRFLQNFSLGGDGYAALFFNKYQGGSAGSLTVLDAKGTELSVGLDEEVLSISAAGGYIGVLTANSLTIYDAADLSVYAGTDNSNGARRIVMQSDGSALLVATSTAELFVPQ